MDPVAGVDTADGRGEADRKLTLDTVWKVMSLNWELATVDCSG